MVTTVIGRIFLKAYNEKYKKNYSPKEFFIEEYYPLFFANEKYFIYVKNSPMVQQLRKGEKPTRAELKLRLEKLITKLDGEQADGRMTKLDASIAVGYPAKDSKAVTSGQVTIDNLTNHSDDAYLSWIGAGFGITVGGGELSTKQKKRLKVETEYLSILPYNNEILLHLFEGWTHYRSYLDSTPALSGKQINTWNAHWLEYKLAGGDLSSAFKATKGRSEIKINTLDWYQLLAAISKGLEKPSLMAYVYRLGNKTDQTIGFIPIFLSPIRKTRELYEKLFKLSFDEAITMYKAAYSMHHASQAGQIGLRQMEPKGLREIMQDKKQLSKDDDSKKEIQNNIYQIWLLAMLNNEELWVKTQQFAQALLDFEMGAKKKRTDRTNKVKSLLESTNKRSFIVKMTAIITEAEKLEIFEEITKLIHLMPHENVLYFLTLVGFHYAREEKKIIPPNEE